MNHISKIHQEFSRRLNNPRVLTNPEEFLGENFEEVLNFWLILDDLSEKQWRDFNKRNWAFRNENRSEWLKTTDLSFHASYEVVSEDYADEAAEATYDVTESYVAVRVLPELIAMHKILEVHQQPLTFLPMFLEVL